MMVISLLPATGSHCDISFTSSYWGNEISIFRESITILKNSVIWDGARTDFFKLMQIPDSGGGRSLCID